MAEHKFQDIWKEQCAAARNVRVQYGVLSSLDYEHFGLLDLYTFQ
jgi:hypothetical protein